MGVGLWIYESERRNRGKEREIIGGKVKEEGMKTGVFGCVRAKGGIREGDRRIVRKADVEGEEGLGVGLWMCDSE